MGLYDVVTGVPDVRCAHGNTPDEWQTKDGDVCLNPVHYTTVSRFYGMCRPCECWIEFVRKAASALDGFERLKDETREERSAKGEQRA